MADKSAIEWTDATWNPIVGCSVLTPGCTNCYAMKMAARIERMFAGAAGASHYRGLTKPSKAGPVFTGKVALAPEHIQLQPLRWRRARKIFVNSMGDLFHEAIPDEWIDRVFAIMALSPQHTFQVLTKRAARMQSYVGWDAFERIYCEMMRLADAGYPSVREKCNLLGLAYSKPRSAEDWWPLRNVWLGVSTERQKEADERIPLLLQTPAAVRFISAEPLLSGIDLTAVPRSDKPGQDALLVGAHRVDRLFVDYPRLDWVIVGGESWQGARPMHPQWARGLRDQCASAGVPFFFKQWGEWAHVKAINVSKVHALCGAFGSAPHVEKSWPRALEFLQKSKGVSGSAVLARTGKASAGRLLDGREHNAFPAAAKAHAA